MRNHASTFAVRRVILALIFSLIFSGTFSFSFSAVAEAVSDAVPFSSSQRRKCGNQSISLHEISKRAYLQKKALVVPFPLSDFSNNRGITKVRQSPSSEPNWEYTHLGNHHKDQRQKVQNSQIQD
jgi:hypothetical protein